MLQTIFWIDYSLHKTMLPGYIVKQSTKYANITPVLKNLAPLAACQVAYHFQSFLHSPFSHAQWRMLIISTWTSRSLCTSEKLYSLPLMVCFYVSTHRCLTAGDNAFSVYGPQLWNDLLLSLRETQTQTVKETRIFNLHFGAWTFSSNIIIWFPFQRIEMQIIMC